MKDDQPSRPAAVAAALRIAIAVVLTSAVVPLLVAFSAGVVAWTLTLGAIGWAVWSIPAGFGLVPGPARAADEREPYVGCE